MNRAVLLTLATGLMALGGGVAWQQMHPVSLASLAPAAGAEAETSETAPTEIKKSHTGKVLNAPSFPMVTIAGQQVITRKMLYDKELAEATPEGLKTEAYGELLRRRVAIGGYAHNPSLGPNDAPLQLVEMTDLSCVQCMETSKVVDAIMDERPGKVHLTNIHAPVTRYNDVNLAAFYGKVAQRGGVFWQYRKALETLQAPGPDSYFETLVQAGMDRMEARRLLQTESRRFYRELDADTQLANAMHLGNPPHVFVNGIHVGTSGIPLEKLQDVVHYEETRPKTDGSNLP